MRGGQTGRFDCIDQKTIEFTFRFVKSGEKKRSI